MGIATNKLIHQEGSQVYIPAKLRKRVLKRDKTLYVFCGKPTNHICHLIPRCRGGKTNYHNLAACCEKDVRAKKLYTPLEYFFDGYFHKDFDLDIEATPDNFNTIRKIREVSMEGKGSLRLTSGIIYQGKIEVLNNGWVNVFDQDKGMLSYPANMIQNIRWIKE